MKSIFPLKISLYLARCYIVNFLFILCGLLAVVYFFDIVELLRRAAKVENVALSHVLLMGFYKLPEVGQLIFPFAILFSAMLTFWQLSKKQELVIVRAAGLSAWQFLSPILLAAFLIGVMKVAIINPMGSVFLEKYRHLEAQSLKKRASLISFSEQGLWLRQENVNARGNEESVILHAKNVQMPIWKLSEVIVYFFDEENNFLHRVDSQTAQLNKGKWLFNQAVVNQPGELPQRVTQLSLETNLDINELMDSFASAETISFWKLPEQIRILQQTGFDPTGLKIYYQKLLSEPLLFMAMILLAGAVSLRHARMQAGSLMALTGIVIGFVVFFSASFLQALGASQQIPVMIAAWFPALISFILGVSAIATVEDG